MTLGAARTVLLVLLLAAFCAGCDGSSPGSDPGAVSSPQDSSSPSGKSTPPVSNESEFVLATSALRADLTGDRCPHQLPAGGKGPHFGSSLDHLEAVKMILCRYRGLNDAPRLTLRGSATITDPATVESWRQRFNALPSVDPGKYHCPFDDGSVVLAGFLGKDGTIVVAQVSLRGCRFVTIGTTFRSTSGSSASLPDDILKLVP